MERHELKREREREREWVARNSVKKVKMYTSESERKINGHSHSRTRAHKERK